MPVRALDIVQIRGSRCGLVRAVMSGQVRLEAGDGWHAPEAIGIEDLSLLLTADADWRTRAALLADRCGGGWCKAAQMRADPRGVLCLTYPSTNTPAHAGDIVEWDRKFWIVTSKSSTGVDKCVLHSPFDGEGGGDPAPHISLVKPLLAVGARQVAAVAPAAATSLHSSLHADLVHDQRKKQTPERALLSRAAPAVAAAAPIGPCLFCGRLFPAAEIDMHANECLDGQAAEHAVEQARLLPTADRRIPTLPSSSRLQSGRTDYDERRVR